MTFVLITLCIVILVLLLIIFILAFTVVGYQKQVKELQHELLKRVTAGFKVPPPAGEARPSSAPSLTAQTGGRGSGRAH